VIFANLEGYLALAVSILAAVPPERAFIMLEKGPIYMTEDITEEDVQDMIKLKETLTWPEIGEIYGITHHAVFRRVKNYKKKTAIKAAQ